MNSLRIGRFVILMIVMGLTGCRHFGSRALMNDRISYNDAILTSWKTQTLLNIVRFRYNDLPEFVEISTITNGYEQSHSGTGTFGAGLFPNDIQDVFSFGLAGSRTVADRPTLQYAPQTGAVFTRDFTTPLTPIALLNQIEAGASADTIFDMGLESINGVPNAQFKGGKATLTDPRFTRAIETLEKARAKGYLRFNLRSEEAKSAEEAEKTNQSQELFLKFVPEFEVPQRDFDLEIALNQMWTDLNLDHHTREFKVVTGLHPQKNKPNEIALSTRSVFRIMTFLALNVQVPVNHLADGRAVDLSYWRDDDPPITIFSGYEPPCDSFASVQYQGCWFWINWNDVESKRSMLYLRILLALADTEKRVSAAALTIRAN